MATRSAAGGVKITVPATWIASWTLYDLANTIWSYGIFSYAIGLYLTSEQGLGESQGNLWLQISIALSVGINALISPAIGAISDRAGRRLPYLLFFFPLPSFLFRFFPPSFLCTPPTTFLPASSPLVAIHGRTVPGPNASLLLDWVGTAVRVRVSTVSVSSASKKGSARPDSSRS
jgi:MFS family permease